MRKPYPWFVIIAIAAFTFLIGMFAQNSVTITREMIASAEKIIGLDFSDAKRDSMTDGLQEQLGSYNNLRTVFLPNSVMPSVLFNPIPAGFKF